MRMTNKEDIIRALEEVRPDGFNMIKITWGGKHKLIGSWSKHPFDDISATLFDLSLRRKITSVSIIDGGAKYPSYLQIGTSECRDYATNIDSDVIDALCLAYKRRMDADFPLTVQYLKAMEEKERERMENEERSCSGVKVHDWDLLLDDLGMP